MQGPLWTTLLSSAVSVKCSSAHHMLSRGWHPEVQAAAAPPSNKDAAALACAVLYCTGQLLPAQMAPSGTDRAWELPCCCAGLRNRIVRGTTEHDRAVLQRTAETAAAAVASTSNKPAENITAFLLAGEGFCNGCCSRQVCCGGKPIATEIGPQEPLLAPSVL